MQSSFRCFAGLVKQSGQRFLCAVPERVLQQRMCGIRGCRWRWRLSQSILEGTEGAWRMQGGGFAGTIQAYVPGRLLGKVPYSH